MAQEPPIYDLVLLLNPALDEDRRLKIVADVETLVDQQGEIVSRYDWGVRQTTFEVRKHAEAEYHLIQFRPKSNDLLDALDHALKITDGVLRFRIVKLRHGTPEPPDLAAVSAIAPEEDGDRDRDEREDRPRSRDRR